MKVKLSIIIPVYNEIRFIERILKKIQNVNDIDKEIIIIDDYSIDGTRDLLTRIKNISSGKTSSVFTLPGLGESLQCGNIKVFLQDKNQGKGACIRRGLKEVTGNVIIIQDADLEYDPDDYRKLLEPIIKGEADVVFGSRFSGGPQRVFFFWHYIGNKLLTFLSNMLTNLNLSDMETCYKMFKKEVLNNIEIEQNRFGFEPEITQKVARGGWRIYEVPISYYGRTYQEGKKIGWKDGFKAICCIIKYGIFK